MPKYKEIIREKIEKIKNSYFLLNLPGIGITKAIELYNLGITIQNFESKKEDIIKIKGISETKFNVINENLSIFKSQINDIFSYKVDIKTSAPTTAFSQFIINKKQGDWAESVILKSIDGAVRYGRSDTPIAGDPGFEDFWNSYQKELLKIGKRPDILIYNEIDAKVLKSYEERILSNPCDDLVKKAVAGIEVRSSSYKILKNNYQSFTPKLEDLILVMKWIDNFDIPYYYLQVFFNKAFIISFEKVLDILCDLNLCGEKNQRNEKVKNFILDKQPKNQFKYTFYIDLRFGSLLGNVPFPTLKADKIERDDGRIIVYVNFEGDKLESVDIKKYLS